MSFRNQAAWDRALRLAVGTAMLVLGWAGLVEGTWGLSLRLLGPFPLVSGLLGWDPVYALLGFRTHRG